MYCDVLREATNEWGNFHLKQPLGIFSEQGYRLGSAEEVGCQDLPGSAAYRCLVCKLTCQVFPADIRRRQCFDDSLIFVEDVNILAKSGKY